MRSASLVSERRLLYAAEPFTSAESGHCDTPGFRVQGSRLRVQGLGFKFRIEGAGLSEDGAGARLLAVAGRSAEPPQAQCVGLVWGLGFRV